MSDHPLDALPAAIKRAVGVLVCPACDSIPVKTDDTIGPWVCSNHTGYEYWYWPKPGRWEHVHPNRLLTHQAGTCPLDDCDKWGDPEWERRQ